MSGLFSKFFWSILLLLCFPLYAFATEIDTNYIPSSLRSKIIDSLALRYGLAERSRISLCVSQTADRWTKADGNQEEFERFCNSYYIPEGNELSLFLKNAEDTLEVSDRAFNLINLKTSQPLSLSDKESVTHESFFALYSPSSHFNEDMYATKAAFAILLNFPIIDSASMSRGKYFWEKDYSKQDWMSYRLAALFDARLPASLVYDISANKIASKNYAFSALLPLSALALQNGGRIYNTNERYLVPWRLIDEIRMLYSVKTPQAFLTQELFLKVLERSAALQVSFIDFKDPEMGWEPVNNIYFRGNTRISSLGTGDFKSMFYLRRFTELNLAKEAYYPNKSNFVTRYFENEIEIPENQAEKIIVSILKSPKIRNIAAKIKDNLGRDLRPFDIWYSYFDYGDKLSYEKLDRVTAEKYSSPSDFHRDLPRILLRLGFSKAKSDFLTDRIVVQKSRGKGECVLPKAKGDKAYLRIRMDGNALSYEAYKSAIGDLGKCCAGIISVYNSDSFLLAGLPGPVLYDAYAVLFINRACIALGLEDLAENSASYMSDEEIWDAWRSAGFALHSLYLVRWLRDNPTATDSEASKESLKIAKEIWNSYFKPFIGFEDSVILASSSRHYYEPLSLSSIPLGFVAAAHIRKAGAGRSFASEMDRMCSLGRVTPEVWLVKNTGSGFSDLSFLK